MRDEGNNKQAAGEVVFVCKENDAYTDSGVLVGYNCVESSSMSQGNARGCI